MKNIVKYLFSLFSIAFFVYLSLPAPDFPKPPPDSLQSQEPADKEILLRRAYFTNLTREEVLNYYQNQMKRSRFMGIPLFSYRLNYPPEEAYTLIRDQTRSTFLEEIVHPFRESLYINGFEPKNDKDVIFIDGKNWRQKITVRYVTTSFFTRIGIGILTLVALSMLYKTFLSTIKQLVRLLPVILKGK